MTAYDEDTLLWIEAHLSDDPDRLRLKYHGDSRLADAITQIDCRRRAHKKLPSYVACRRFRFPSTLAAEQSTSEVLARYHASLVPEGAEVIDLTCGLGIDAFAIASRAAAVTAIEIDEAKADCARYNADVLGIRNLTVICVDSAEYVETCNKTYDIAFIDPARRGTGGRRLFALADCSPDVTAMLPAIARIARRLIIKASPMLDISRVVNELGEHVTDVTALGTPTECKEIVVAVDFGALPTEPAVHAVTLADGAESRLSFTRSEEAAAEPSYRAPAEGMVMYEPYPAVMKAAPLRLLAARFGVAGISADSHLYVADDMIPDFPGTAYRIVSVRPFTKRDIAAVSREFPVINVASRGLGISADDLRRRLKVRDGGDLKLTGVIDAAGNRLMVIAQPIK